VKETLDLCLACKGCKGDCPVNVDMATYKAEFLSHYYKGRLRPGSSYGMGLFYWWARLASFKPGVVNFFMQTAPFSNVEVPEQSLCCGRPLYDHGMLDTAERLLRQILETLEPQIVAGTPIIGLEPSCIAVFRDELTNLFPNNENAKRLKKQAFLLSEFLGRKVDNYQPPKLHRKAVVHGHCHHKAIMRMGTEEAVLRKLGLDYELLDSGCCGMAGAFGFEKDHYDVSIKCGERVLLPAVRNADKDTLIIADGFSCREQIAQTTNREALHLAEVIQLALHEVDGKVARESLQARDASQVVAQKPSRLGTAVVASMSIVLVAAPFIWRWIRRKAH
jgi:Fe-S oxidoreductase